MTATSTNPSTDPITLEIIQSSLQAISDDVPTAVFSRAPTRAIRTRPWVLDGGFEGSPNYAQVIRKDGTVEEYAVVTAIEVNEGDVIRIHTGNGGGYGDPRRRPREAVLEDIRNGFATDDRAQDVYGVVC
jgi:N-methylhydantoinase B